MLVWIVIAWLGLASVGTVLMRRRGHDAFAWGLLFALLGPLAIPVAVSRLRHPLTEAAVSHSGTLDVIVGFDGSPHSEEALSTTIRLLGSRITSLTIATVLDEEAPVTVRGKETEATAREALARAAHSVTGATNAPVTCRILFGAPAAALDTFAAEGGYELVVVGSRGRGASHAMLGSTAQRLAGHAHVPVLVGSAVPTDQANSIGAHDRGHRDVQAG